MDFRELELGPSAVARCFGISPSTVKKYEQQGIIASRRNHNGYRLYPYSTLKTLRRFLEKKDARAFAEVSSIPTSNDVNTGRLQNSVQ